MKKIYIPAMESFDEATNTFIEIPETVIEIEHSLSSVSKWESKWHIPFFEEKIGPQMKPKNTKTHEQVIDYIRCMTLTPDVDPNVYYMIPSNELEEIGKYIEDPMSSIDWSKNKVNPNVRTYGRPSSEPMTSELIYYWMISNNIPPQYEYWHLNKLLSLIRMCNLKNTPKKKMSAKALMSRNASLNEARRKALNTTG